MAISFRPDVLLCDHEKDGAVGTDTPTKTLNSRRARTLDIK